MKKAILIIVATLMLYGLYGQNAGQIKLSGTVVDQQSRQSIIGATIVAGANKGTVSDLEGRFILSVAAHDTIHLHISFVGFKPLRKQVITTGQDINLGNIELQAGVVLNEVVVEGKVAIAKQKGDTLAFNAAAVKVNEEAKGINIVKKLPGFALKEDKIESQGEQVKKIYIDGEPFFEDDPKNALSSLPADLIKSIEVFDDYGEIASFTGYASGGSVKAINIVTHKDSARRVIGNVVGGYGSSEHYDTEATLLYKQGKHDLTLVADMNNINKSRNDLSSFKSFESILSSKLGMADEEQASKGEQSHKSVGMNYNYSGKKSKLNLAYTYGERDVDLYQDKVANYQDTWKYQSLDTSMTSTQLHKLNSKYTYESAKSKLILSENLLLLSGDMLHKAHVEGAYDGIPLSQIASDVSSTKQQFNMQSTAVWLHKLNNDGRSLSAIATLDMQSGELSQQIKRQSEWIISPDTLLPLPTHSVNQEEFSDIHMNKLFTRISYKEPLSLFTNLNFTFGSSYSWNKANKQVSTPMGELQSQMSDVSDVYYLSNKLEVGYSAFGLRLIFNAGASVEQLTMTSQFGNDMEENQSSYYRVHPLIFGKYDLSSQSNLMFLFRSFSTTPTIGQLQPTVNIADPTQAMVGNPELKPGLQYMGVMRYVKTQTTKSRYLLAYVLARYSTDFIGVENAFLTQADTIYGTRLATGTNVFSYANMGPSFGLKSGADYSQSVPWLGSNLNLGMTYAYNQIPTSFNDVRVDAQVHKLEALISLSSKLSSSIDFFISNANAYNHAFNSENSEKTEYYSNITEASLYVKFLKSFSFQMQAEHYAYSYFQSADNQQYLLLDLSLGKSFWNKKAYVKLTVHDVFRQSQNIEVVLHETYSESIVSNNLAQYAMLSFTYKF